MNLKVPYKDLLMEMLAIPATSRNEQERSNFLEGYLNGMGMAVKRIHNNLLLGDPEMQMDAKQVLLNSHMDTVSPAKGWKGDPYVPLKHKERIVGLGSNDAGASVVTLIAAYHQMKEKVNNHMNLMLLISAEEEVSGAKGISAVLDHLGPLDAVIVGEPTGMRPAVAERGLMVLDAEVRGKAGHAARKEGDNAIYLAMKDLQSIKMLSYPDKSEWLPDPGAQVTMINSGTSHNVVPDLCRYVVDVRSNDRYPNEAMLNMVQTVCEANLVPRSIRLQPSSLGEGHFLMEAISACNMEPFGSSTLSDMALIPFPSIKMGPGDSARSHTAGEYILLEELDEGVDLYCRFLKNLKDVLADRKVQKPTQHPIQQPLMKRP